ncbi:PepSY domain-containing protein [Ramlibacter pallidus]|uniref:PepSY domain-containing protein n=1 Tax=Ramlibacter pallidus TaxID=2780087 RepID=A0ABR9S7W4_9BURK|nr:PepSY domain-containing protein [Ramlibacter pallidus]MBE7369627.1 PepSY domain-containing protein [Ramlibacter pallidus]
MQPTRKLICALALAVASAGAWAQVSRDGAAAAAQRVSPGRVLAVERADADNRPAWRVKVLTPSGEVRVILIDAATGRPL